MRKHLLLALALTAGMPLCGNFTALAEPSEANQSNQTTISGTVLDENNEPVIGANVSVKGQKGLAVTTDLDGKFKLRVTPGATLVVSYVGCKPAEVKAANGVVIRLQPSADQLDDLVVVGYGTQKKANLTGAVSTVDVARTMDGRPQTDVAKALQGAVPGLTITSNNGDITSSGAATLRIRGTGTLSNDQTSNPLIVVDGVPVDDLSFVNPDDIQDISVLKDASSSAIYGTRAAFGVILITTKNPVGKDRVTVKYSNNFGWTGATIMPEYSDVPTQLRAMIDQQMRSGGDTELFGMHFTNLLPYAIKWQEQNGGPRGMGELRPYVDDNNVGDYYIMRDAQGKVIETLYYANWDVGKIWYNNAAPSMKHNASIEGRSGRSNYRASFGYDSRTALENINPGKMNRYTAAANINTEIFSWLRTGVRFNYSSKEYSGPNGITGQATPTYMWRWGSYFNPYGYREYDGKEVWYKCVAGRRDGGKYEDWATDTKLQAYLEADLLPGLTIHADYTYDLQNFNSKAYVLPVYAWNNWTNTGMVPEDINTKTSATQSNSRATLWTTNIYATYSKTFARDYNLKLMAGGTAEEYNYNTFSASRNNLLDTNLPNLGLTDGGASGTEMSITNTITHRATAGFFGRVNFDYKGIYLFEANGRYDGSSRFPANDQWAFFPSASVGYRFSEEPYFTKVKDTGIISNGKVRASWGAIGNEAIGSNMFLSTISGPNTYWWLQTGTINPTKYSGTPTLVSSSLTWERVETLDIGFDLGFLSNSLMLTFDWFQRDTKDMLAPGLTLPGVLGASAPYVNEGQLRTRGWELGLSYNHNFGDVNFYANFNIYDGKTKVVKYNNENMMLNQFYTGAEYGAIWGFETDRYFTVDDCKDGTFALNWTDTPGGALPDQTYLQNGSFKFGPGDVKFKDLDGNGVIDGGYRADTDELWENHREIYKDPNDRSKGIYPAGSEKNHGDLKKIGNSMPRYEYSLRLGAAWKGFDIDCYFQGVGKRDYWTTSAFVLPLTRGADCTYANQNSYNKILYNDAGQVTGYEISESNTYPCLFPGAAGTGKISGVAMGRYNFYPQSRYLSNMSYLRFKQLTVGYTLPTFITQKALIQRARLYFTAENLCLLHNGMKGTGIDPEIGSSHNASYFNTSDNVNQNFGRVTPMPRTFSFGLQVTF